MTSSPSSDTLDSLQLEIGELLQQLPTMKHAGLIRRALSTLVRIAQDEKDRLDWKILAASLEDLEQGFESFYAHRHIRKVTIFGSARIQEEHPEYHMAREFAQCMSQQGFMVMTGAGGGIMQAGNEGAGPGRSFGLNIRLPFEQEANPYIAGSDKLIYFKYFFTRKLFLLRESDAIALFPGGFGTQDEAFECLTLTQTGKYGPAPLVLIDRPGGTYWHAWNDYIHKHLLSSGLISPDDPSIYTITDRLDVACSAIANFYRVYHSSRYVREKLVLRLKSELTDGHVETLNQEFRDIVVHGRIEKSQALPEELGDETGPMPRLVFHFNQRDLGRLYQMISTINEMGAPAPESKHPEQK